MVWEHQPLLARREERAILYVDWEILICNVNLFKFRVRRSSISTKIKHG